MNGATFFSGTTHFFSTESGLVLSVLLMMVFAYCLSLCSTSDAVICSVIGKGFPVAAQLAFLVFGPMMDIKNTMLLGGMCSVRLSARMFITTFIVCFSVISLFAFCGGSHLL